jgi:HlyD family secretion protein
MKSLSAALLVLFASTPLLAQGGGQAPPPTLVAVELMKMRKVTPKQSFVGTVMPVKKAVIGSAVDGRVAEFHINEGDYIDIESESGGVLAVLLRETIGKEVEAAEAELRLREEELKEMEEGSRPEEIEQGRARMEAAKAGMEYSRLRLQRLESLFRSGRAASPEEVDEATSAANQAHNAYLEAVAAWELVKQGPRAEQKAQAAARRDMQQAVVDRLKDQFEKHVIRTRFSGYVSAEHTELGAWVNRGDPVAEIVALDEVDVEVHVVEDHVPFIDVGEEAPVSVAALRDRETPFPGHVVSVVPQADARTRTFPVKVRVQNEKKGTSPVIKSGMLAGVLLPVGPTQSGLAVPKEALVLEGQQKSVWVVDPKTVTTTQDGGQTYRQGLAKKVPVQLGVEDGTWVLVRGDVQENQYVVNLGNERIFNPTVRWRVEAPASKRSTSKQ